MQPSRECYSVTGGYRVRVWVSFLEWPRPGVEAQMFIERLQKKYSEDYAQKDFEIELSYKSDGSPKQALVKLGSAES